MLWLALLLFGAAAFFYSIKQVVFALICFGSGALVLIGLILYKSVKFTGKKTKQALKTPKGNHPKPPPPPKGEAPPPPPKEKAKGSYPSQELIGEGFNNLGKKAGDHLWEEKKVWTASSKKSGFRERLGESSKNLIDKFLELFK